MKEDEVSKNKAIRTFVNDNKPTETGEKELVIRTGDAEHILYPNPVRIAGVITAPGEFYKKRKKLHNPDKCHVIYDRQKGTLSLVIDEQYEGSNYQIEGVIMKNPDLTPFCINSFGKTFTVKELMQVVKFNRVHFADKDDNAKIVLSLQNFKAKVDQTLEDSSNNRGAESKIKITNLEHELQESFMLQMPIFKGGDVKLFKVDICVQISDGSVVVWLESRDLKDIEVSGLNSIIDTELEIFKDIVCIEK